MARRRRRMRVDERPTVVVAAVSGIAAAFAGLEPTGSTLIDVVLAVIGVGVVTWAGSSAPWWVLAVTSAIATAVAENIVVGVFGAGAFFGAMWIGVQRREQVIERAVVAGLAFNALARSDLDSFHGATALIGLALAALTIAFGLRRRHAQYRRAVWIAGIACVGVALVALAGLGFGALQAEDPLRAGNQLARDGIESATDGDYAAAADQFEQAAAAFSDADSALSAPWAQLAAFVPVVAQNRAAGADLAAAAAQASDDLAVALRSIVIDDLRLVDGQIDLTAVEIVGVPLGDVRESVATLDEALTGVRSPWLLSPVSERLDEIADEVSENRPRLENAAHAAELLPGMLGADEPRTYFVAFTTPAEARGSSGFMGNYAIITADEGEISVSDFGRTRDLNQGGSDTRAITGPDEFLAQYWPLGFNSGPGGTVEDIVWSNVTVSPHFPTTAEVIAELYPQSGGTTELDGVFAMDPYVLAELLRFTGPVSVDGQDRQLNANNVVDFLLVDQYELDEVEGRDDREDFLEDVSEVTIERLLSGAVPDPVELIESLSPLVAEGRLLGWARAEAEQELFAATRLAGGLPSLDGGDGVAISVANSGANKIDVYLERTLEYDAVVDTETNEVSGTITVTLTNTAPATGLPNSVIGNRARQPDGTNTLRLATFAALPIVGATSNGEEFRYTPAVEQGWTVASSFVSIPAGESLTVEYAVAGVLEMPDGYTLATNPQPLVIPELQQILVVDQDGIPLVQVNGPADEPRRYSEAP
ncbi:MAG: DUF4012 domain-containing protein [Actinomycetota bacterium]